MAEKKVKEAVESQVLVEESAADRLNPALPVQDEEVRAPEREVSANDISADELARAAQEKAEFYTDRQAEDDLSRSPLDKKQEAVLEPKAKKTVEASTKK